MKESVWACAAVLMLVACGGSGGADAAGEAENGGGVEAVSYLVPGTEPAAAVQREGLAVRVDAEPGFLALLQDGCDGEGHFQRTQDTVVGYVLAGEVLTVYLPQFNEVTFQAEEHQGVLGAWRLGYGGDTARIVLAADTVEIAFRYEAFCAAEYFLSGEFVRDSDFQGLARTEVKDCAHIAVQSAADASELGMLTIEYVDLAQNFAYAMNFAGQGQSCRLERLPAVAAVASEELCQAAWTQWRNSDDYDGLTEFSWADHRPAALQFAQDKEAFFACMRAALGGT